MTDDRARKAVAKVFGAEAADLLIKLSDFELPNRLPGEPKWMSGPELEASKEAKERYRRDTLTPWAERLVVLLGIEPKIDERFFRLRQLRSAIDDEFRRVWRLKVGPFHYDR